jgi:signal transduction histidine kinase/ActR/RegA family two-component response regulator
MLPGPKLPAVSADWRVAVLRSMVRVVLALGGPTVALSIALQAPPRLNAYSLTLATSFLALLAVAWLRPASFLLQAWFSVAGVSAVGIVALLRTGYLPGATLSFALSAVLVGLLGTRRLAIGLVIVHALVFLLVGWLNVSGRADTTAQVIAEAPYFATWLRSAAAYLTLATGLVGIVLFAMRQVEELLQAERRALEELASEQQERSRLEAEKRETLQALLEAQKREAVGRLAGAVAHDFNNSLLVIQGWAELLGPRARFDPQLAEALRAIDQAARRSAQLTRRLLTLGRREVSVPRPVQPATFLADFARTLGRVLPEDVRVELQVAETGPILVDAGQLEQALLNLALNARDAMRGKGGGLLTIRCREEATATLGHALDPAVPRAVVIEVEDTGSGIEPAALERIFEPYFTTKGEAGTGLGLASVEAIARGAGGAVWAASRLGDGSKFSLAFPAAPAARDAPELPAALPAGKGHGEVILVVEDEREVRELMVHALERAGFSVIAAEDGDAALAKIEGAGAPDVALLCTDGVMPGLGTAALVARFEARYPDAGILVCSGHLASDALRAELTSGRYAFLAKPFPPSTLVARVQEVLAHAAGRATWDRRASQPAGPSSTRPEVA